MERIILTLPAIADSWHFKAQFIMKNYQKYIQMLRVTYLMENYTYEGLLL
jgi:hypothetical protein